jgi:SAM-dependent methyltransferase
VIPEFKRSPDRNAALAQYRRRARFYDLELALFEPIRRRAIARLALKRGNTVLDVGCGTGLSLALLHEGVGAHGRIVGIEQSPEMIEQARQRIEQHAWRNVTLLCSAVESARIPVSADAALFLFTHDILRSSEAVANVMAHLAPGARVVAAGLKWARPALVPTNLFVLSAALHSVTSLEGLSQPWSKLADTIGELRVESLLAGAVYMCSGVVTHDAAVGARARG